MYSNDENKKDINQNERHLFGNHEACVNNCEQLKETTPKERVECELDELNEKIVKLSRFLFGKAIRETKLSNKMIYAMREQLRIMQEYATILQRRLFIWGKTDEELNSPKCIRG